MNTSTSIEEFKQVTEEEADLQLLNLDKAGIEEEKCVHLTRHDHDIVKRDDLHVEEVDNHGSSLLQREPYTGAPPAN